MDDQIVLAVQGLQVREDGITFFKTGVTAAVDAQGEDSSFFQKIQSCFDGDDAGFGMGGHGVVTAGEITEVEGNAANGSGGSVVCHVCVGLQMELVICRGPGTFQAFFCFCKRPGLDVKGNYFSFWTCKFAEQLGIVAVSHGSIDAEISGLYLLSYKVMAPLCDLIIFQFSLIPFRAAANALLTGSAASFFCFAI